MVPANKDFKFHFLSDIHLGSNTEPNFLLLKNYLNSAIENKVTDLFFLGDIFDYWVSDRSCFVDPFEQIVDAVTKLIDSGVNVYYFEGNHDFHLKKFWQDKHRVQVFKGPARIEVAGVKLYLAHGDEMDPGDKGYLFLRWLFRCLPVRLAAHYAPLGVVEGIGAFAGKKSKGHVLRAEDHSKKIIGLIRKFAEEEYFRESYDYLLAGHFHIRDEWGIKEGRAVNLGTWLDRPVVYEITKNNNEFKSTPVVMLSSKDGLFDRAKGRIVGSDQYLTKPFSKAELLGTIRNLVH